MDDLWLKWIHILSATILFGTGIGSAFYLFMANRSKDIAAIRFALRHVVIADWIFTTPAIIVQLLSGIALAHSRGYPLFEGWLLAALLLFALAGICWLPVVWLQIAMRDLANQVQSPTEPLPKRYWHYARLWTALGAIAFPAVAAIFYLMIQKPF